MEKKPKTKNPSQQQQYLQQQQSPEITQESLKSWSEKNKQEKNGSISEIIENLLFLGNKAAEKNEQLLKKYKIKAILNIGAGNPSFPSQFNCLKIGLLDKESEKIDKHLSQALPFIHNNIQKNQPVFVHCQQGISRSPTFIIAYLCEYYNLSIEESLQIVKNIRPKINPKPEFLKQLQQHLQQQKEQQQEQEEQKTQKTEKTNDK